jgi:hypothetical protein
MLLLLLLLLLTSCAEEASWLALHKGTVGEQCHSNGLQRQADAELLNHVLLTLKVKVDLYQAAAAAVVY